MEAFEQYLLQEHKDIDYDAVSFKYSHNTSIKVDKKSNIPVKNHTISVNIKLYDKNVNLIKSVNIKFVNNILAKVCEKKLINIAPSELNNKFMAAKGEIIRAIHDELAIKYNKIKSKINELNDYRGKPNDSSTKGAGINAIAINDEFKGEQIDVVDAINKANRSFDM